MRGFARVGGGHSIVRKSFHPNEVPVTLKETIGARLVAAMKAKDATATGALRLVQAALQNREIELRHPLDDAETVKVCAKFVKQRDEAIAMYEQGGRADLAAQEKAEREIVAAFLPQALSEEEIAQLVEAAIAETKATTMRDMGAVMKALAPKIAGRADGGTVSAIVKRKLSGS